MNNEKHLIIRLDDYIIYNIYETYEKGEVKISEIKPRKSKLNTVINEFQKQN